MEHVPGRTVPRMRDDSAGSWSEGRIHRLIFEHSSEALAVIDDDGRLVMANLAARALPGIDVERFFVWAGARDAELASLRAQLRVGGRGAVTLRVHTATAGDRVVSLEGRAHGPYYVIAIRDVTERRQLDEEVQQLRKLQDGSELTASVVHDFNNVLTTILFGASLLADDVTGLDRPSQLALDIRESAERAAGLVRRVLSFIRRPASKPERVNVGTAVAEIGPILELVGGKGIALTLEIEPEVADCLVERDQLDRVLVALARNAREAMPHGGRLTVAAANVRDSDAHGDVASAAARDHSSKAYVSLTMTDTGRGMAAEVRESVFAGIDSSRRSNQVEGQGLASAYRFARRSGGCIAVRSAPEQGTTVAIYLPSLSGRVPTPAPAPPEPADLPRGSETILVIDPDDPVRGAVAAVLRDLGYSVLDASSGEAALQAVEKAEARVRLVLADLLSPGLHGVTVLERLRERGHSPRLLWMSGDTDRAIAAQDLVDQPLLRKAFTPHELAHRVRDVLDSAHP